MKIAILKDEEMKYDNIAPFNPSKMYPEYPFKDLNPNNKIYGYIRNLFFKLGMDKDNFGESHWNPFGEIISPGDDIVIKPNFVRHYNIKKEFGTDVLITNGSLIRVIIDYTYIALKGKGSIIIADSPIQSADFNKILDMSGLNKIKQFYDINSTLKLNLLDLRNSFSYRKNGILITKPLKGDPLGYSLIDLKEDSELNDISEDYSKFRVTNYDKDEMVKFHNIVNHSYIISNTVLNADLIINLPKLKTHKKAGFTCALKNIVGVFSKDSLPHHRTFSIKEGGDEYLYKDFRKRLLTILNEKSDKQKNKFLFKILRVMHDSIFLTNKFLKFKDNYFEGSWYGNDTIPRTIADLNKILIYSDQSGILRNEPQRKMFILVDGIVAGEKEGPLKPMPKNFGVIIGGYNPLAIDLVCSKIIGYNYNKIPIFRYLMNNNKYSLNFKLNDLKIISKKCTQFDQIYENYGNDFIPPESWKGHT